MFVNLQSKSENNSYSYEEARRFDCGTLFSYNDPCWEGVNYVVVIQDKVLLVLETCTKMTSTELTFTKLLPGTVIELEQEP